MRKLYFIAFSLLAMAMTIAAQPKIIYLGAVNPSESSPLPSDSAIMAYLEEVGGMDVTYVDDDDVQVTYDWSPYDAAVYGESCSSNRLPGFKDDNYPLPCVSLEPLVPRENIWAWAPDRDNWNLHFQENREKLLGWDKLQITDASHFITDVFDQDEVITYSTADTTDWECFAIGIDLTTYVPAAVPLATNMSSGTTFPCLWAMEAGTVVPGGDTLDHRLVINGTHAKTLAIDDDEHPDFGTITITDDFLNIILRSVRWVLGAEVGINDTRIPDRGVSLYPNPVTGQAMLSFHLDEPGPVSVKFFNLVGQQVRSVDAGIRTAGENTVRIQSVGLPAGMYLYMLEAGQDKYTGKFQVVK